jgi:hypothetical protein
VLRSQERLVATGAGSSPQEAIRSAVERAERDGAAGEAERAAAPTANS